jgi:molybdopterin molybdotransferase
LKVSGQATAGHEPEGALEPGCAVRIMTGAPVPEGADAVVRFEETGEQGEAGWIGVPRSIRPYENIRPAGEDARQGEIVLTAGTRIRPAEIGLLAAVGRTHVTVHRRPKVAVLVTGDEVVGVGATLEPGQIWNSNGPMIVAQVRQCGGEPIVLGVARDTTDSVRERLSEVVDADLLITTGGVSVGDFDVVKDVLQAEGRTELWQVRIKPGRPLAFGWIGDTPLIGLPGNPVAAYVAFAQFARPAILTMLGRRDVSMPTVRVRLLDRIENRGDREQYARVRVEGTPDGYVARIAGGQGSGMLTSLARSNGLLVIPETCDVAEPGMSFTVQMPDWDRG